MSRKRGSSFTITRSMAMSDSEFGVIIGMHGEYKDSPIRLRDGEKILLGRDRRVCNIALEDPHISRRHVRIAYSAHHHAYEVEDLSTYGTFLANGTRLPKEKVVFLPVKTRICLAKTQYVFVLS